MGDIDAEAPAGADLRGDIESPARGQHPFVEQSAEAMAVQVFLHDEVDLGAVVGCFGADIVHHRYVRMVQRRRGACFLLESRQALGIRGELGRQHLDRHLAAQPRVFGQVHLPHAA